MTRALYNIGDVVSFRSLYRGNDYRTGTGKVKLIEDYILYEAPRYGLEIIETSHPFYIRGLPHFWEKELTLIKRGEYENIKTTGSASCTGHPNLSPESGGS
jgi:hypothetical protein